MWEGYPANTRELPVSAPTGSGLQVRTTTPVFYMGSGNLDSGPHVCSEHFTH